MTVSRALTGKSAVSLKTKERVLRCAAELGYQPDRWARSLVTRRSSMIGVVVPDIAHSYFAEITFGIEDVIDTAGYDILLCHSRGDVQKENAEIRTLVGSRVDGLIIASEQYDRRPPVFVELRTQNIPFVLIDRFFPKTDFLSVRPDDRAVGRLATQCLIDFGHRRIAHIQGPAVSTGSIRYRGYLDALRTAGIDANQEWIIAGDFYIDSGRDAMKRLLSLKTRPTAVFAANDPMAIGAIYACRDAGLRIPEEMSIIGAGNIEGGHHPNPFVSTVDWPRAELGRTAATLLLEAINGDRRRKSAIRVFAPRLLIRQSTGRPLF
jgi:LacI family transcriptional regulator